MADIEKQIQHDDKEAQIDQLTKEIASLRLDIAEYEKMATDMEAQIDQQTEEIASLKLEIQSLT